ncbi:MAG TPA: hypothetical protein DCZ03_12535 [Gammaproteobacteria bacterium]|nr:hypothetical protein [Gammaproteobacteria bacterium]
MNTIAKQVTTEILDGIPLAQAMGLTLESYNQQGLTYRVPFELNTNVHQTAFAGSISTLMILTGWALLNIRLREEKLNASVVLAKHQSKFRKPIESEFSAVCLLPSVGNWNAFLEDLYNRRRARLELRVVIDFQGDCAAEFTGSYVAQMNNEGS